MTDDEKSLAAKTLAAIEGTRAELARVNTNFDVLGNEVKRHGTSLENLSVDVREVRERVVVLEEEIRAGVHVQPPPVATHARTPSTPPPPAPAAGDAERELAPLRAPQKSVTSEVRESIRATALETKKQTPMIERIESSLTRVDQEMMRRPAPPSAQATGLWAGLGVGAAMFALTLLQQCAQGNVPFTHPPRPPILAPAPSPPAPPPAR